VTSQESVDDGVMRRHFVSIATGEYQDPHWGPLSVDAEVAQLKSWLVEDERLGDRRFDHAYPHLACNPDEGEIREAFKTPRRPWTERDAAVVFVTGHGEVADQTHWLVLRESENGELPSTGFRTSDLISWLRRRGGVRHLLLIIDACFAGAVAADILRLDANLPSTWLILPSAGKDGEAQPQALTNAVSRAVAKLRSGEGAKHGVNRRYFTVAEFRDTVQEFLPDQELTLLGYRGDLGAEHVCLPNPHFRELEAVTTAAARHELALPKEDLQNHWAPRARGTDRRGGAEGRWLFTGRAKVVRELIAVVRSERDEEGLVTLVTGGAGCGKSAVLARLVTLSDPDFTVEYADAVHEIPEGLLPDLGAVDVAVLATGRYPHEVVRQIGEALGVDRPDPTREHYGLEAQVEALADHLAGRAKAPTVVLDALDEAEDPTGIARVLARLAGGGKLRLLIGVRSPGGSEDPLVGASVGGPLADLVEDLFGARRLRVDEDLWWNQDDIRAYAESTLNNTPGSPYRSGHARERVGALAAVIADQVGRSFLVARLAATALTQRADLADPDDPAWRATLTEGVIGAFRADLVRLFPDPNQRLRTVELLRAVAFAYGRGLPWGGIWPLVANGVADRHGKFGDADIAALLASPISAYLITDQEDDVTVYRLFHDALRGTLREHWRDLLVEHEPTEVGRL